MQAGTSTVIANVLKYPGAFRTADVVNDTGLSKQLVTYHLNKLRTESLLNRSGIFWSVIDKNGLLDYIVESANKVEVRKADPTTFLSAGTADRLNALVEVTVLLKCLGPEVREETNEFRMDLIRDLDDTIKSFKNLRKYLGAKQFTEGSARKKLKKVKDSVWSINPERFAKYFGDQGQFEAWLNSLCEAEE